MDYVFLYYKISQSNHTQQDEPQIVTHVSRQPFELHLISSKHASIKSKEVSFGSHLKGQQK